MNFIICSVNLQILIINQTLKFQLHVIIILDRTIIKLNFELNVHK